MKNFYIKLIVVTVALSFGLTETAAQTTDNLKGKEMGINFRNLWFGNSAEIIVRKPNGENQFKRKTYRFSGTYSESNSMFSGQAIAGLPNAYKTNLNSNFNLTMGIGKEKRVTLLDQFYFYHGPSMLFSLGANQTTTTMGNNQEPQRQNLVYYNAGFGVGYFGGVGYQVSERFSVQIENLLQIQANVRMQNQSFTTFDVTDHTEETNQTILGWLKRRNTA